MKRGLVFSIVALVMSAGGYYAYAAVAASKVTVTEKEFKMNPSPSVGKSGLVTFTVKNNGHLKHQFIVLKTNVAQDKLPVKASKAVLVGKVEGKISAVGPGQTKRLTVKLPAGKYILLCNLPAHYQAGQHAAFRVG